jgi:hypothetical protein
MKKYLNIFYRVLSMKSVHSNSGIEYFLVYMKDSNLDVLVTALVMMLVVTSLVPSILILTILVVTRVRTLFWTTVPASCDGSSTDKSISNNSNPDDSSSDVPVRPPFWTPVPVSCEASCDDYSCDECNPDNFSKLKAKAGFTERFQITINSLKSKNLGYD